MSESDASSEQRAFLVDIFQGLVNGRSTILAAGRLANGESFAMVVEGVTPTLYLRRSDSSAAAAIVKSFPALSADSDMRTMDGETVCAVSVARSQDLRRLNERLLAAGIRTYEGDLDLALRYRIGQEIKGIVDLDGPYRSSQYVDRLYINPKLRPSADQESVDLRVLSLDIETNAGATRLLGLSLVSWRLKAEDRSEEVLIVGQPSPEDPDTLSCYPDERSLLQGLISRLKVLDPDIITGWNVIDFDLTVIARLAEQNHVTLTLGRSREKSYVRAGRGYGHSKMVIQGRQVIDALQLVRHSLSRFEDHRLETVAQAILGRGKTLSIEEWEDAPAVSYRAYEGDRQAFCKYALKDARLVRDIIQKQRLLELTYARCLLASLPLDKAWGSIAPFDALYISAMRKRKRVAPTLGVDMAEQWSGSGGLVLEPKVGLHSHVLIFDFKSLYPSVMRTFNIDPLAFVEGQGKLKNARLKEDPSLISAPNGAVFDRTPGILPEMLHEFFEKRDAAKREGNALASYAYKIIMNSFYGVLATDACRFADMRMADAITGFGQHLLLWMRAMFEREGLTVLYGDTDSLFVESACLEGRSADAAHLRGEELSSKANRLLSEYLRATYAVDSHMELEFEKYYRYLFLPANRHGEGSRAKNYAGLSQKGSKENLEITGLEAVRSDWTALAQALQRELLIMLFHRAAPSAMLLHVRQTVKDLLAGKRDAALIYRKRIRKPLASYTKTTPPHIKAARLLPRPVRVVRYILTDEGPQPLGFVTAAVDYEHYIEKQIRPIVEGLAPFAKFSAERALDGASGFAFTEDMDD